MSVRLHPALAWTTVPSNEKIPAGLIGRYREIQRAVDGLAEDVANLAQNKEDAQAVLNSVASTVKAARDFAAELDKLNGDTRTASEGAQKTAQTASDALTEITKTQELVREKAAALSAMAEKADTTHKQVDEHALAVATLLGQANVQVESISQSQQRSSTAADDGTKAREKAVGEAEQIAALLAQVTKSSVEVNTKKAEVETAAESAKVAMENAKGSMERTQGYSKDVEGLATQAKEAYRIVTTTGLAGAFYQRARSHTWKSFVWLVALAGALFAAAYMGSQRTHEISALLQSGNIDTGVLLVQVVLSVLTVGAPVWMAWLSTKQVTHYFRLSEDYGFKATFAKAYEGFRDEAVKLDPLFQARLFSSALQRLDENPLRLISDSQAGSPLHDFLQQPWFLDAMKKAPELKENVIEFLRKSSPGTRAADQSRSVAANTESSSAQPTEKAS
jgi:hypothetical protein